MALAAASSAEHFFSETGWTESHLRGYRVEHSVWDIHPVVSVELNWDWERVYGPKWKFLQDAQPYSTVLAAGSAVRVFPKGSARGERPLVPSPGTPGEG
jgi:hypothetical protein